MLRYISICLLLCTGQVATPAAPDTLRPLTGLTVTDLGHTYDRDPALTPDFAYYAISNRGGTTSIRNNDTTTLKWKTQGYYQRNRELGQVFNVPADTAVRLDALVLRTGNSAKAILPGAAGAAVYVQLFEVVGQPRINDNGTPIGAPATHGFTENHRADDFLEGIDYRPLALIRGGIFPELPPTDQAGGQPGHLRYLRWDFTGPAEVKLAGGKRYAFLVGFDTPGPERGFTLGNDNRAGDPATPALAVDANGQAWWSIRREGNGTLPPTQHPGEQPPPTADLRATLRAESLFAPGYEGTLSPTSVGYPDVDTYRTMEFYLELRPN